MFTYINNLNTLVLVIGSTSMNGQVTVNIMQHIIRLLTGASVIKSNVSAYINNLNTMVLIMGSTNMSGQVTVNII